MPTPLEKRIVINAMRAADHEIEALIGNVKIVRGLLTEHGWRSASTAQIAVREAENLRDVLDDLHEMIADEALAKAEDVPDDDVIEPRSGGGSKGGGGGGG